MICRLVEDTDSDIKQTAVFGLGVLAKCGYLKELDPEYKWLTRLISEVEEFKQKEAEMEETTKIQEILETSLSEDEFIELEDGENIDFGVLSRLLQKLREVQLEETKFISRNSIRKNSLRKKWLC